MGRERQESHVHSGLLARGSGVDTRAPQGQRGDWKRLLRGRNRTLPDLLCETKNIKGTSLVVEWIRVPQCRGHSLDPQSRKIPHAAGRLSPRATVSEPGL